MGKKKDDLYVEPIGYFTPKMRRILLEGERDGDAVDEEVIFTPERQLRLIDWLISNGISEEKAWEGLDYTMYGDE